MIPLSTFASPSPYMSVFEVPYADISISNTHRFVWNKPVGVSMVAIWAVGPGGNGAPPSTSTSGYGGGASGSFVFLILPAMFVPQTLSISPSNLSTSNMGVSGKDGGLNLLTLTRGANGSGTSGGVGPGVPAGRLRNISLNSARAGTTGGSSASPNISSPTQFPVPGAGGGGTNAGGTTPAAGGSITLTNLGYTSLPGGAINSPGAAGISNFSPLPFFCGGTGGGGGNLNGGDGNKGAYGCGGGGGGGNATGGVHGNGGQGGNGLVIIYAW